MRPYAIFVSLLVCSQSEAELQTVITAVPTTRCTTSADSASCAPVEKEKAQGLRMSLMKDATASSLFPKYYWVIDGKPRTIERGSRFGMFDVYHCAGGMVVIHKVAEQRKILGDLAAVRPPPNFRYMEITRIGLSTITYYGEAATYEP